MTRSLFVSLALSLMAFPAHAESGRRPHRGFPLFEASDVGLRANRVVCNINAVGEHCVHGTGSFNMPGGFWPRGTQNQYVFNGGLSVAGIIAGADLPQFDWPGDTVGAFFFDERGDQQHGATITRIYDGLNARDRATWPAAARAADPELFHPLLRGRSRVSDQDTWVRYWDLSANLTGRRHPAGLIVDQRSLAFSTAALEDVVFLTFRIINASARDAAAYQRLAAAGYDDAAIAELAALGAQFQQASEARFGVELPDTGYTLRDVYVGYAQDPDVSANAGNNFSSANFVFRTAFAYSGPFVADGAFQYPPQIHAPPFAAAPGLVGTAFLRSPDVGGGETRYLYWTKHDRRLVASRYAGR